MVPFVGPFVPGFGSWGGSVGLGRVFAARGTGGRRSKRGKKAVNPGRDVVVGRYRLCVRRIRLLAWSYWSALCRLEPGAVVQIGSREIRRLRHLGFSPRATVVVDQIAMRKQRAWLQKPRRRRKIHFTLPCFHTESRFPRMSVEIVHQQARSATERFPFAVRFTANFTSSEAKNLRSLRRNVAATLL